MMIWNYVKVKPLMLAILGLLFVFSTCVLVFFTFHDTEDYVISHTSIQQPIDHADPNGAKFKQNIDILIPKGAPVHSPVFFHLAIEDTTDQFMIRLFREYGRPMNVIFIQAEHRGLGQSVTPDPDQTVPSYIKIGQALADYHRVIEELKKTYTGPWMVAGYRYGGSLAINLAANYPEDMKVILSSSGLMEWPFMMEHYDQKVRSNFGDDFYHRLASHIDHLAPAPLYSANWKEREFLVAIIYGLSEQARFASLLPFFKLLSYLPTSFFFPILHGLDFLFSKSQAWHFVESISKKTLSHSEAVTGKFGWRVGKYQQCTELGVFAVSSRAKSIFTKKRQDFIKECESLFGQSSRYSNSGPWSLFSMVKNLKVPMVYVSGGMDPWSGLGLAPDYQIALGKHFHIPKGFNCPDEDDVELGRAVLSEMLKSR
ncbi:MAG: hypothetical protein HYV97_16505 [Bdellovibrio sp.]|nr:hypothetical protein [Bdellovibrio sp.]